MKLPNKRMVGLILAVVAGTGATTPASAGVSSAARENWRQGQVYYRAETVYRRDRRFDRHYYPRLMFRGGWYALNYPYYWGFGPAVGYYDPYDANGNYFPYPLPRR